VLDASMSFTSEVYLAVMESLMLLMGVKSPDDLTTEEDATLRSFHSWFTKCRLWVLGTVNVPLEPAFTYYSLRDGFSLICLFADNEGKLVYSWNGKR
jgi:hypothetical protein